MLDRNAIIRKVAAHSEVFGLSIDRFVISGGAALVMHGLLDKTSDIDAELCEIDFEHVADETISDRVVYGPHGRRFSLPNSDLVVRVCMGVEYDTIDGINVYSLNQLLEQYTDLTNRQDILASDMVKIEERIQLVNVELARLELIQPYTSNQEFSEGLLDLATMTATKTVLTKVMNYADLNLGDNLVMLFIGPMGKLWTAHWSIGIGMKRNLLICSTEQSVVEDAANRILIHSVAMTLLRDRDWKPVMAFFPE